MTIGAGFDPGIACPAYGVVRRDANRYAFVRASTIRSSASEPLEQRLDRIHDELGLVLRETLPSYLAIEDQRGVQYAKRTRGEDGASVNYGSYKTLLVMGVAIGCARAYRVPWLLVQPQRVKVAVLGKGSRSAEKGQVQDGVFRLTGARLSQGAADAVGIAIAGSQLVAARRRARAA